MRATCDGLVIRETDYGDSDKLLTVLTAEYGQMTVIAKGARSSKSKVMPLCRLFTYANLEYYEKNGRRWLSGGSVNDSFFGISADIRGFALASYVVQLAAEITGEGVEAESVLDVEALIEDAFAKSLIFIVTPEGWYIEGEKKEN